MVIKIAKYPLAPSNSKVNRPKNFPPDLKTLDAPIFPDPDFLISFLINILVKINPKGIEPSK